MVTVFFVSHGLARQMESGDLAEPLVSERLSQPEIPPRRSRDAPWLAVFLLYWLGMLWIAACAVREGDISRLSAGMDEMDHLCGTAQPGIYDLESRPYLYYACLQYGGQRPAVCMSSCPALSGHYVRWYNGTLITCETHGRSIPATTYPSTHLGESCVPAEVSRPPPTTIPPVSYSETLNT